MKKSITIAMLLMITAHSFAQQEAPQKQYTKQDYLQKSKRQKTTAWILLGGGTAAIIGGSAIYNKAYEKAANEDPLGTLFSFGMNVDPTGAIIAVTGSLAALGSIPFFISASKNKRYGLSLSLKNERAASVARANLKSNYFPAVAIKLAL